MKVRGAAPMMWCHSPGEDEQIRAESGMVFQPMAEFVGQESSEAVPEQCEGLSRTIRQSGPQCLDNLFNGGYQRLMKA